MKTFGNILLAVVTVPLLVIALLVAGIAGLFNAGVASILLGADYPVINTTTVAGLVAANSKVKEELWVRNVVLGSEAVYDDTPFADNMIGRMSATDRPNPSKLMKAVVEIMDTRKIRGTTVNIPTIAGIGGEGIAGESQRQGNEADLVTGNFTVTIEKHWFAVGLKQNVIDETVVQDTWSSTINYGLRARHNKKKNDSIVWRMLQAAGFGASAFAGTPGTNLLYPPGIASRATLKSANIVDTTLITYSGDYLPGLGARPMDTTTDSAGSIGELYMFLSTHRSLVNLESETAYNTHLDYAYMGNGEKSPVFKGGFTKFRGHGIYRWINRDHANRYAIGSALFPKAKLGVALTGANTASEVQGGGLIYRADTVTQWFQDFSNAPFHFYGGVNDITATTATTRYLMIVNTNGDGKWNVYSYTVNDGNKITIAARVTLSLPNEGTTHNHPQGADIYECNVLGTVLARSLMFGAQAVAAGIGSINGNPADPQMGKRVVQKLDYENDIGVSVEGVWGCAAVQRAGDNAYPNFVVIEHAATPPGAPTIV